MDKEVHDLLNSDEKEADSKSKFLLMVSKIHSDVLFAVSILLYLIWYFKIFFIEL